MMTNLIIRNFKQLIKSMIKILGFALLQLPDFVEFVRSKIGVWIHEHVR